MYRFEKLLVVLSLGENDQGLVTYARNLAEMARSESVHFIYSREPVEIPAAIKKHYPWMTQPINVAARERIEKIASEFFGSLPNCKTTISVEDSQPTIAALETILEESIDLVLVGTEEEELPVAVKLARKAPCSVLAVPPSATGDFTNICLGLDMSRYSNYVVDVGTAFASAKGLESIECVNFFKIPHGFHKTNLSREKFVEELREQTQTSLESYLSGQNLRGITAHAQAAESNYTSGSLHDTAEERNCDLIIIGCRGKDAISAILLGSSAEEILQTAHSTPVLAVKEKGTGIGFLENLLGLNSSGSLL